MRFVYFLTCFLLAHNCLFAQQGASDLLNKLHKAGSDSEKIAAYNSLIRHYNQANPDSATYYAKEGIAYATDKNYRLGEAMINTQLGTLYETQGSVDIAKERLNYALKIYTEENYQRGRADVKSSLGAVEAGKGNFNIAAKYFIEALKLQEHLNDYKGLMISYLNLGSLYMQQNDTSNSSKYLDLAENVSRKTPIIDQTISLYNTIGVMTIAKGDTQKGLQIFMHDLELSDRPGFANSHVECLLYIGEFYIDKKETEKALHFLQLGLKTATQENIPEIETNILVEMGQVLKEKDPASAMACFVKAKAIAERRHDKSSLVLIYKEIAGIYNMRGNYKDAFYAEEQAANLTDSTNNINTAREIASMGAAYGFETNMRISQLEKLSSKNAAQRNIIIAVAVAFLMMLIILLCFYRKTMKLNRQMTIHEKELKELNSMKDKLFSVIGHDLRGPIARIPAILDIYEDPGTSDEEKRFLLDNLKEHTKVSLETFDKLLYWGLLLVKGIRLHQVKMNPKGLITESMEFKKMKAAEKQISVIDKTPPDLYIYADLTHFDFIIRNLLANALKYTYQNGSIEIDADTTSKPGFTVFSVKDSGIGMSEELVSRLFKPLTSSEGTNHEKGHGIGLMLCKEFAVQNGGDLWVESEPGKGATFFFSVKSQRKNLN